MRPQADIKSAQGQRYDSLPPLVKPLRRAAAGSGIGRQVEPVLRIAL
jgi:hypothetical protein